MTDGPRNLLLDIETSPTLAWVWGLFNQNISAPDQVREAGKPICWAAKWDGEKKIFFEAGDYAPDGHGDYEMIRKIHNLLDEADWVTHFNGQSFDIPHLNWEFARWGLGPPSPFRQIDLLLTARKQFRAVSNKLAFLSQELGLEGKVKHEGFALWLKVMEGDPAAWKRFRRYNIRDVTLLEEMLDIMRPWLVGSPSHASFHGDFRCPSCGGKDLVKEGYVFTNLSKFPRYHCKDCGRWSRDTRRVSGVHIATVAA